MREIDIQRLISLAYKGISPLQVVADLHFDCRDVKISQMGHMQFMNKETKDHRQSQSETINGPYIRGTANACRTGEKARPVSCPGHKNRGMKFVYILAQRINIAMQCSYFIFSLVTSP